MRAFWSAAYPWCLGNCAKCRSRRRKKARKCPKIKSWWWHSLQGCPSQAAGLPNARKQRQRRPIDPVSTCPRRLLSTISLLLVFSPCGLTAMMPAQRLRPYPVQLRLMAIKDGLSHRCVLLFHLTASHQIKTKTGFPNFLISLFPYFLFSFVVTISLLFTHNLSNTSNNNVFHNH